MDLPQNVNRAEIFKGLDDLNQAILSGAKYNPEDVTKYFMGLTGTGKDLPELRVLRDLINVDTNQIADLGKIPQSVAKTQTDRYLHRMFDAGEQTAQQVAQSAVGRGLGAAERGALKGAKTYGERFIEGIDSGIGKFNEQQTKQINAVIRPLIESGTASPEVVENAIKRIVGDKAFEDVVFDTYKSKGLVQEGFANVADTLQIQGNIKATQSMFNDIAGLASDVGGQGMKQIPDTGKFGALAGKYLPANEADEIIQVIDRADKWIDKAVNTWKQLKLFSPLNFATNFRNFTSNIVLNSMPKDGLPIYRFDVYANAFNEWRKGGPLLEDFVRAGGKFGTFTTSEAQDILRSTSKSTAAKALDKWTEGKGFLPGVGYGKEGFAMTEEFGKFAQFYHQIKNKGKGLDDAMKTVNEALFDYSKLPTRLNKWKSTVMPFVAFKYFSTKLMVDTLINRTSKITSLAKAQRGVEALSPQVGDEYLPEYMRDKRAFYWRLPFQDTEADPRYLDLNYMIPYADIGGGLGLDDLALGNPFLKQALEQGINQSYFMNKPITNESLPQEQQLADRLKYAWGALGPNSPIVPFTGTNDKLVSAFTSGKDMYGRDIDPAQALLSGVAGIKTVAPDPESSKRYNRSDVQNRLKEYDTAIKSIKRRQDLSEREKADTINKIQLEKTRYKQYYADL